MSPHSRDNLKQIWNAARKYMWPRSSKRKQQITSCCHAQPWFLLQYSKHSPWHEISPHSTSDISFPGQYWPPHKAGGLEQLRMRCVVPLHDSEQLLQSPHDDQLPLTIPENKIRSDISMYSLRKQTSFRTSTPPPSYTHTRKKNHIACFRGEWSARTPERFLRLFNVVLSLRIHIFIDTLKQFLG